MASVYRGMVLVSDAHSLLPRSSFGFVCFVRSTQRKIPNVEYPPLNPVFPTKASPVDIHEISPVVVFALSFCQFHRYIWVQSPGRRLQFEALVWSVCIHTITLC